MSKNHSLVTGWTPLQRAAKEGYSDTAQALLNAGAEIDKVNSGMNCIKIGLPGKTDSQ